MDKGNSLARIGVSFNAMKNQLDTTNALTVKLETYGQSAIERMLIIVAIGILHSLETGNLSVDEAHAHLFNPYTLETLKDINANSDVIDFWHRSLFLEDVESLLSRDKLQTTIVDLKQIALKLLAKTEFEPYKENKWVVVER